MLSTGESIGDRAAGTVVLSNASFERCKEERANAVISAQVYKAAKRKTALLITAIVVCFLIASIGAVLVVSNATKDSEEYKLFYDYLISGNTYKEMDADESDIHIIHYSSQSHVSANGDSVSQTAKIGFIVKFKSFEVVYHNEDGVWQVCDECTGFD